MEYSFVNKPPVIPFFFLKKVRDHLYRIVYPAKMIMKILIHISRCLDSKFFHYFSKVMPQLHHHLKLYPFNNIGDTIFPGNRKKMCYHCFCRGI